MIEFRLHRTNYSQIDIFDSFGFSLSGLCIKLVRIIDLSHVIATHHIWTSQIVKRRLPHESRDHIL